MQLRCDGCRCSGLILGNMMQGENRLEGVISKLITCFHIIYCCLQVDLDGNQPVQQLLPDECARIMCEETERALNVPLNQKHAVQFASIIGHMQRAGVVPGVLVVGQRWVLCFATT